ncbi:DUF3089 domain-containing protein [Sphingomonas sp. LY160]|uniref:DUF3089 domain-containing protein n=1 Tax=Sphingomonas sp. LY160 TaxID=3095342 RepID=UPI002ADECD39|nr:DUF3089 domain-containing protein [Sphingomonas sp. LY160]MEA1072750.1 DUF3089 domain-containing protein [Sphingomonas sp. LY160]
MIRPSVLALAALIATPASAQPAAAPAATDYDRPGNWLCLPGRTDPCAVTVKATELNPSGYGKPLITGPSRDADVDCFIVYPTVSRDQGMNSDLIPGDGEERASVVSQFARFASGCRTYAPMYRSMTLGAVTAAAAGANVAGPAMLAYGDVAAAWRTYLSKYNEGRPFVLIGHSQGSLMLQQLIAREIEGRPAAKQMRLAIIPGFNVMVPQGKLVGGTFKSTPLCSRAMQTGCVMSWVSYRERNAPPAGAIFGIADKPGMTVGCVNPGKPGATGWVPLESYWNTRSTLPVPGGPITWSSEGAPPTPFVRTQGLVSARCVNDGPRGYLSIRTNADPADKRTDRIGGEVGALGFFIPGWGMHLIDISAAQGNLARHVEALNLRARTTLQPAR